jgi:hypothetical protein
MMNRLTLIALCLTVFMVSCEKDVLFDEPDFDDRLVVEGRIETGQPPFILLTRNSKYYGTTSLSDIGNSFVNNAIIKVSNGIDTVTLSELVFDTAGVSVSIYTDPVFFTNPDQAKIIGTPNTTYYLWIEAEGDVVSAVTTIPNAHPLDSIWFIDNLVSDRPDLVRLMCRYTDPPEPGQYVRYFTNQNNTIYLPGLASVFDDRLINGTTFDFSLDRGVNRNDTIDFSDYGYFYKGDTVSVKWCNIDFATYNFYNTLEFELNSGGPFSSPIIVQGNIQGGLGVWAGYNCSFKSLIIPE